MNTILKVKKNIDNSSFAQLDNLEINENLEINNLNIKGNVTGLNFGIGSINPTSIAPGLVDQNQFSKLAPLQGDIVDTNTNDQDINSRKTFNQQITTNDILINQTKFLKFRNTNLAHYSSRFLFLPGAEQSIQHLLEDNNNNLLNNVSWGFYPNNDPNNVYQERFKFNFSNVPNSLQMYHDGQTFLNFSESDEINFTNHNLRISRSVTEIPKISLYRGSNHFDLIYDNADVLKIQFNNDSVFEFSAQGDFITPIIQQINNKLGVGPSFLPTSLVHLKDQHPILQIEGETTKLNFIGSENNQINFSLGNQNIFNDSSEIQFRNNTTPYAKFNNDGRCSIGTNSNIINNVVLNLDSNGSNVLLLPKLTTFQRDTNITPLNAMLFYNQDINKIQFYDGSYRELISNDIHISHTSSSISHGVQSNIMAVDDVQIMTNKTANFDNNNFINVMSLNTFQNCTEYKTFDKNIGLLQNTFLKFRKQFIGNELHCMRFAQNNNKEYIQFTTADNVSSDYSNICGGYFPNNDSTNNNYVQRFNISYNSNSSSLKFEKDNTEFISFFERSGKNLMNINNHELLINNNHIRISENYHISFRGDGQGYDTFNVHCLGWQKFQNVEKIIFALADDLRIYNNISYGYFIGNQRANGYVERIRFDWDNSPNSARLYFDDIQVLTFQQPGILDSISGNQLLDDKINEILGALRAHGLIAS